MRLLPLALLVLVAASPGGAEPLLLVGNKGEDSLSIVDLVTGRELRRLETGPNPHEIAISPDGTQAAVVAYGGTSIDIFDISRRERVRTIELSPNSRPHGIAWLRDGRIVATAEGSDTLVVVAADGRQVRAIPTGQEGTHMVAVSNDGRRAYTANMGSGTASVIDLVQGRKLRDLPAGTEPEGIALNPDGSQLWVADRRGDAVRVFDTSTFALRATLQTGKTPIRVAISPDGRTAVTSNLGDGTLSLFDTGTLRPLRTIRVGGQAEFQQVTILFAPGGERLYVAETGIDRVAEMDLATGEVLGRLPAGRNGDGLGIASSPAAAAR